MQSLAIYFTPRMLMVLALGFTSGLPLGLTGSNLSTWLFDAGIDIKLIGAAALITIPYSFKFIWSPLVDHFRLPFFYTYFGRRRGWLIFSQILLFSAIALLSLHSPKENLGIFVLLSMLLAACSATQDIVVDAIRTEMLPPSEYGYGTAMTTLGYRIGMLVCGVGGLVLAEYYSWHFSYAVMAAMVVIGVITAVFMKEPATVQQDTQTESDLSSFMLRMKVRLQQTVVAPFANFMTHDGWVLILVFIATYKLGDAFLGTLTNPFLREIGFTKIEIAAVVKAYGLIATLLGTFVGAWVVHRYGIIKPLLIGGILHAVTNLMFLWQAKVGIDPTPIYSFTPFFADVPWSIGYGKFVLALGITLENFTGAVSSVILVVLISSLCNLKFTATQFALLTSLASIGRTVFSSSSGLFKAYISWEGFFIFSVLLAIPSLIMLFWLKKHIAHEEIKVRTR